MSEYRFYLARGLRRRGQMFGDFSSGELRTEEFDDDEQFCQAVASELLEIIKADREEGEDDD